MLYQLLIGSALITATALVAASSWWGLEVTLAQTHHWVVRPPHGIKILVALTLSMLWTVVMLTASVWIWASAFVALDIFATWEASVYFSLVAFTTLGFGDILLPPDWRLLGGMAAANGLLVFGLLTAMLVETLRQIRQRQIGDK